METQPAPQLDPTTLAAETPAPAAAESAAPPDSAVSAPTPGADGSDQNGELNIRQTRLLAALVTSTDVQAACKAAEVSRQTAYQWMKQPAFEEEPQGGGSRLNIEHRANATRRCLPPTTIAPPPLLRSLRCLLLRNWLSPPSATRHRRHRCSTATPEDAQRAAVERIACQAKAVLAHRMQRGYFSRCRHGGERTT